jgi:hypothetical protein
MEILFAAIGKLLFLILLVIGGAALFLELRWRLRPGNELELTAGDWSYVVFEPQKYLLTGKLELINKNSYREVMIPQLEAKVTLLSQQSLEGITHQCRIIPRHKDSQPRDDGYWLAYIVQPSDKTALEIQLEIHGENLQPLQTAWIEVKYDTYGPAGQIFKTRHIVLPLQFPDPSIEPQWRQTPVAQVMPIRTHVLTHTDRPEDIIARYVAPHAQPGDIVAISETPMAIMQERLIHHNEVKPGWLAKRLCQYFYRTSSFATAGGLQVLIDLIGPLRVIYAFVGGTFAKVVLKKPGMFYALSGDQARLIDDVTGTLPPYDQFIVLGPADQQNLVNSIKQKTGLDVAIIDANDLKIVDVLASSGVPKQLLQEALRANPAGNADEQTPVVLIRPNK